MTSLTVKKFSNVSTIPALAKFGSMVADAHKIIIASGENCRDFAVIAELMMMMSVSRKCNHKSSTNRNSISYERVPANINTIATQFEMMNMNMTTSTIRNTPTRHNRVTSAIIQTIQTITDFSTRIDNVKTNVIVITNVHSTMYAAVIVFAFRNVYVSKGWGTNVKMIIMAGADTIESMNFYMGVIESVELVLSTDRVMDTYRVMSSNANSNMTVETYMTEVARMCTSVSPCRNTVLCWITNLNTYASVGIINDIIPRSSSIMEAVPCSDPSSNMVRIVTTTVSDNTFDNRVAIINNIPNPFSCLRWFNNMIRHMDISGMCFDCTAAYMVAKPMIDSIGSKDEVISVNAGVDELPSYFAIVSTVGLVNLIDR